ncbi:MAG TPA: GNAT family N-acetyltransferase [Bacillota bacterium]|nr:GNAT family N-acetyltransferase [Bacillota bacterium]
MNEMHLVIREAEEKDLESMIALYAQLDMDDRQMISLEKAKGIFKKISNYPFFKVYVAVLDDEIAGTFELLIMDNLGHQGIPSGIIEDVVVVERHQGKGIGKAMMAYAVDICRGQGCYKVALSSNSKRKRAHQFYESLGFKKHGYSFYMEV